MSVWERIKKLEREIGRLRKALEVPESLVIKEERGVLLIRDPDPWIPYTVIDREGRRHSYKKLKDAERVFEYYVRKAAESSEEVGGGE